jgi:NitT/TauT family transport system permease protein
MRRWTTALLVFGALVAIWEWLVRAGVWSPVLVPSPVDVGKYLVASIQDKTLLEASYVTLKRLLLGYAVGLVFGLPLGLLIARFKFFQDTLGLLALGFQTLPSVCWAPMALLWFGQTETAMFFIVIMGSIWSITLAADAGVRNVPPIYARAAQTMGSRGLRPRASRDGHRHRNHDRYRPHRLINGQNPVFAF